MNWDRSKTILILFLIGLNAFLAAMYFAYEDDYTVSRDDIQVITTLLGQQDILLAVTDMPRSFPPVDQLNLEPAVYNSAQLVNTFFIDTSNISQTIEFGNPIFSSPEGTLTIMQHIVRFEPSQNSPNPLFNTTTENFHLAWTSFAQFLQANTDLFPSFEIDQITPAEFNQTDTGSYNFAIDSFTIEFRQHYRGYTILPNILSFTITPTGVSEILYTFYPLDGFTGLRQPIISAVQALFMFKLETAHIHTHAYNPIIITNIDLVHDIAFSEDGFGRITTVPYYRIFHTHGEPMLINAITGGAQ